MANLSIAERIMLEKFLGMESGYVLDFSNNSFQDFIMNTVKIDINDIKYNFESCSKANKLRAFWKKENNYIVGKLLAEMLNYWLIKKQINCNEITNSEQKLYDECTKIVHKLKEEMTVKDINVICPIIDDREFNLLTKTIKESIDQNEPEVALDRLHTYMTKYIKLLCENHKIEFDKSESLNSIFSKYIKYIINNKLIESQMSQRILKYSISILDSFNEIRNNKTFVHDNNILNHHESILIFNNIINLLKFIQIIEAKFEPKNKNIVVNTELDELPF